MKAIEKVYPVPECTLPRIPRGMHPDETWGEQCWHCPHHIGEGHCYFDQFSGKELAQELAKEDPEEVTSCQT